MARAFQRMIARTLCAALVVATPGPDLATVLANNRIARPLSSSKAAPLTAAGPKLDAVFAAPGLGLPVDPSFSISDSAPAPAAIGPNAAELSLRQAASKAAAESRGPAAAASTSVQDLGETLKPASSAKTRQSFLGVFFHGERRSANAEPDPAAPEARATDASRGPSGLKPTAAEQGPGQSEPPAPPAPAAGQKDGPRPWAAMYALIIGLGIAQIAQEFFGQSMPPLLKSRFGSLSVYTSVMVFALVGRIAGNVVGGALPHAYLKTTFLAAETCRALAVTAIIVLMLTGHMTLPLYFALGTVNGFFTGVVITAEQSLPIKYLGTDQALLEKFWGAYQFLLEIVGILAPLAAGAIIDGTHSFTWTLGAYPFFLLAAVLLIAFLVKAPPQGSSPPPDPAKKEMTAFQKLKAAFTEGPVIVWKNPALRLAVVADALFYMQNVLLYAVISVAFGLYAVGHTMPLPELIVDGHLSLEATTAAANIQARVVSVFSLGSLVGAGLSLLEGKRLDRAEKAGASKEELEKMVRRSTLKWMLWGALSFATFLTMLWPSPWPAYAAMFVYGMASIPATLKLKSMAGSLTTKENSPKVMGFIQMAASSSAAISAYFLSKVFDAFLDATGQVPSMTAFLILIGVQMAMAAILLVAQRTLKRRLEKR